MKISDVNEFFFTSIGRIHNQRLSKNLKSGIETHLAALEKELNRYYQDISSKSSHQYGIHQDGQKPICCRCLGLHFRAFVYLCIFTTNMCD